MKDTNKRIEDFKTLEWVREQNRKNQLTLNKWRKETNVRSALREAKQEHIKK